MGTWLVLALLAAAVVLAVRSIMKNEKNGKSISCGGACSHCTAGCNNKKDVEA